MLYAGTTPLFSFKHSILNDTVKELKQWSQSAGNNFVNQNGTSETLRNETVVKTENVKLISDHVPKHLKPVNDESFGHYLAGLIEGSGQFNSTQQLVIEFNFLDASLAYYIKKRLGYGKVTKLRNKKAINLTITHREGLTKLLNLINGKIRTQFKYDAIYKYILNIYCKKYSLKLMVTNNRIR